jgi:hypothetical protein
MARPQVHIPEVLEPETALPQDLRALQRLANLLDRAVKIPGTNRGIGLDAGLGLIPGAGDVVGGALSAWMIIAALRHRVPLEKVLRMAVNAVIDIAVGAIPFLGDVFDLLFQQNVMNMELLMRHRDRTRPPRSTAEIAGVATVIIVIFMSLAVLAATAVVALVLWIIGQR